MTKKHRVLLTGLSITVCVGILVLRILLASSYLSQEDVFIPFAFVFLAWLTAVVAMWQISKGQTYATILTASGAVLSAANAVVIPLLNYTSLDDSDPEGLVLGLARRVSSISIGALLLIPLTWLGMYVLEWWYNTEHFHPHTGDEPEWIKQRQQRQRRIRISPQNLLCIAVILVCTLIAGVVLLFSSGGTTNVFGVQLGAVLILLCIMTTALWLTDEQKIRKILYFLITCAMLCVIVIQHETGLPIFFYLAFALFYFTLHPLPNHLIQRGILIVPAAGICGIMVYHFFHPALPTIPFLTSLLDKIETRIFNSKTVEQTASMLWNLKTGGFWGSPQYDVYVSEASTDFILGTAGHYFGIVFILIIAALFFIIAYSGASHFTSFPYRNISSCISKLGHSMLIVNIGYNLLMVCGCSPVLGVQCVLLGRSITMTAVFSGILMGMALYPRERMIQLFQKLKGVNQYASCKTENNGNPDDPVYRVRNMSSPLRRPAGYDRRRNADLRHFTTRRPY